MSFETQAHRGRKVRSKGGTGTCEPIFPDAALMERLSLLILGCKGNLRVGNGIAPLMIPALAGAVVC